MSSYSTQSQETNNPHHESNSSSDSTVSSAQDEYGNAALQDILFASAASDNTNVDLFSSNSYPALEDKHSQTSQGLHITMSETQMHATQVFEEHWNRHQNRYHAVAEQTGIPAKMIAALHWRESSGNFNTYLHQGDPLGRPAVNWPNNIPVFHNWEDAAVHALNMKKSYQNNLDIQTDSTDAGKLGAYAELYNGLGYHNRETHSPYVYAGSSAYTSGKYVADGQYSASTVDSQVGVIPLLGSIDGVNPGQDLSPKLINEQTAWLQVTNGSMALRQGDNGIHVKALQQKLSDLGIDVGVDGDFGPGTDRAVKTFQQQQGIAIDGIVGQGTAAKINEVLSRNPN